MNASSDMIGMLRRHYLPDEDKPAGIFAAEIGSPGNSGRRADLIWQGTTAASGQELIGHEIKISRADLLAELADPTKSDPWQKYCDRWWLVVPNPALVDGLELPATWGVMTPPSGRRKRSMTIHTKAPALKPENKAPALLRIATWQQWRMHSMRNEIVNKDRLLSNWRQEIENLRANGVVAPHEQDPAVATAEEIVKRLAGSWVTSENIGNPMICQVAVDDVVKTLKELGYAKVEQCKAEHTLHIVQQQLASMRNRINATLCDWDTQERSAA